MSLFPTIIGHARQRSELQADIDAGNVSHAYLFSGARHLGKMTIARWFASQLLVQGLDEQEKAVALGAMEKLMHPDVLVLDQLWIEDVCEDWGVISKTSNAPQEHRAKTPKARTDSISIEDVRALHERLHETGTGRWRCCIIRSVERMPDPAANAFLKILEEPPPGLVFILTTQTQSSLLSTIISRSRLISFSPVATVELQQLLSGIPPDDAQFVLHLSQGAPGMVERLRTDPDFLRERRTVHVQAFSVWRSSSARERMKLLAPLLDRGDVSNEFLLHLALTLREQGTAMAHAKELALRELVRGLKTNAHRQLITQRFALSI